VNLINNCEVCGGKRGAQYDHTKCSKKIQKLKNGNNERKKSKKLGSVEELEKMIRSKKIT